MENPAKPSGPSLFRFVMFKAIENVSHKKKVETDKANSDANELGFTFDDVGLGWAMEGQHQSTAAHYSWQGVVQRDVASASGNAIPAKPAQASGAPGPPLAMQRSGASFCARPRRH